MKTRFASLLASCCLLALTAAPSLAEDKTEAKAKADKAPTKWISLFDGKSLDGWDITQFGSEAEVRAKDGYLELELGYPMTGVTITEEKFKKLPKINYEMQLEAKRHLGSDFFVGLTFPVKDKSCTLVMGGWGGGVVGISSLDGYDASENETTTYGTFKLGQWYKVRLKVTEKVIQVWLDGEQIIDADIEGKKIDTRIEVALSEPLGLASFETTSHIRNFKVRPLAEEELKADAEE